MATRFITKGRGSSRKVIPLKAGQYLKDHQYFSTRPVKIDDKTYFLGQTINGWMLKGKTSPTCYNWEMVRDDRFGSQGIIEVYKSSRTAKWNAVHVPVTGSDINIGRDLTESKAIDKAIAYMNNYEYELLSSKK